MPATIGYMPKRKQTPAPAVTANKTSETVRVEGDLAKMLTLVAIRRGVSIADLLSPHIRPWVEKLYRETVQEMHDEIGSK